MGVRHNLPAFFAGSLFGAGVMVSDMANPARVLAFLDFGGAWDPSLSVVMASALVIASASVLLARSLSRPLVDDRFFLPEASRVDYRLMVGASLFGVGWGLVGLCPGPALVALTVGGWEVWLFAASLLLGMALELAVRRHGTPLFTRCLMEV